MSKVIQIGSVIEFETQKGLAYAQYTHKDKSRGYLLRVFKRIYTKRPDDDAKIVKDKELFRAVLFPLGAAVNRGLCKVISVQPIPSNRKDFPKFRCGSLKPGQTKIDDWWIWDGQKEWRVGKLNILQKRYPIRGVFNDTALIELIERGGYYDWQLP